MSATKRRPTPEELALLRSRLSAMSHEQKAQLAARTKPIAERRTKKVTNTVKAPTTDDELHAAIIKETGFDIPRVAVCEDHCAPFDPIADGFFHRHSGILILKSREAGGTLNVSILQYMLCKYVPMHEGVSFGAIERQAEKAFEYVKSFVEERVTNEDGSISRRTKPELDGEPLRKRIAWRIGSVLSIIIATISGVNSPHPNTAHADELDLMDTDVIAQAQNMSSSSTLPDGTVIPALDIITSTRKSMHGPMQSLIDEIEQAEEKDYEASYKLYAYCVAEVAQEVPCCRGAPESERRARLTELGLDPSELCDCDRQMKGQLAEDVPRTLEGVCRGRFFKSRGWMSYEDVKRKFRKNSQAVWEAELECRRPMADGLYLPGWIRERYTVVDWVPRMELGPIWQGVDFGGAAFDAILWAQGPLRVPVMVKTAQGTVEIPVGAYVIFDELFSQGTGATRLADLVATRETMWRRKVPGFRVTGRFADMAARQQRNDWREHNPPLRTVWYLPSREFDAQVRVWQGIVEDKRYWVDSKCSQHIDDIESWRQKSGRELHDDSSHCLAQGTLVATEYGQVPIEDIRVGDLVSTRVGMKRVLWSGRSCRRPEKVFRIRVSSGAEVLATVEHRFWTSTGWTTVAALRYGDTIELLASVKPSSIEAVHSIATQTVRASVISGISRASSTGRRTICTESFGETTLARSQTGFTSITRTKTGITILPRISNVLRLLSMGGFIISAARGLLRLPSSANVTQRGRRIRCSGTHRKGWKYAVKQVTLGLKRGRLLSTSVRSVASFSSLRNVRRLDSARTTVSLSGGVAAASTMKNVLVLFAERILSPTTTASSELAPENVELNSPLRRASQSGTTKSALFAGVRSGRRGIRRDAAQQCAVISDFNEKNAKLHDYVIAVEPAGEAWVYDLAVEDAHEFYANGILVHNSAAAGRYLLSNAEVIDRRRNRGNSTGGEAVPMAVQRDDSSLMGVAVGQGAGDGLDSEWTWRARLGSSVPERRGWGG